MSPHSKILVVDDEPAAQASVEALLAGEAYELHFASSGAEGLEMARALTPDVIVLDVMMPGMNGFELCQLLRADQHLAEAPVVMITALDDRASRLEGLRAGADDFLSKPIDSLELLARLHTITRLNRYRRLLEERRTLQWMAENSKDGYLAVDGEDRILFANRQARLYLGVPEEIADLTQLQFLALARGRYRLEPEELWRGWPAPVVPSQPRTLIMPETATAAALWLQASTLPQPAHRQTLLALRDVTAEMTRQRDMRSFHAMLSHKLRTPLSTLIGSLDLLADSNISGLTGQQAQIARMALEGSQRLHQAIEDILRYVSAGRLVEAEGGCQVEQIGTLAKEVAASLKLPPIEMKVAPELDEAAIVLSARSMEWILLELLDNSRKFHPRQAPKVKMELKPDGDDMAALFVCDNGVTLAPGQLAEVWSPYYQGEKFFTGLTSGMGLGLPTVASAIWQVGGQCHLRNRQPGPGVEVELRIPLSS